jgi:RND superfamily putative drug exporter
VVDTGRAGGALEPRTQQAPVAFARDLSARTDTVRGVTWPDAPLPPAELRDSGLVDATGRVALLNVAPLSDALSPSARRLNDLLDDRKVELQAAIPGSTVLLTGEPAIQNDFNEAVYGPFPWLVLLVLVLSYLALMRAFKSVLLPLKAVLLNLISILATYGLMVLLFQHGVGAELLGLDGEVRGIASWIPVFLFAFLFGLSMDYEVFLVSRMRELRDEGFGTEAAISGGLARTGRLVTSAALIMVVAFSGSHSAR